MADEDIYDGMRLPDGSYYYEGDNRPYYRGASAVIDWPHPLVFRVRNGQLIAEWKAPRSMGNKAGADETPNRNRKQQARRDTLPRKKKR